MRLDRGLIKSSRPHVLCNLFHRYSLSRSNTAIAMLLCSLFPKFPDSSRDDRYHLQALRHLYVLAAEPRVLVTRDVRTSQACSVDVSIKTSGQNLRMSTPCIIPEWALIEEVCAMALKFLFAGKAGNGDKASLYTPRCCSKGRFYMYAGMNDPAVAFSSHARLRCAVHCTGP